MSSQVLNMEQQMTNTIQSAIETVTLLDMGDIDVQELRNIGLVLYHTCDEEGFVVDFDNVVKWLGYSRNDSAKRALLKNFTKNLDFRVFHKVVKTGRPLEKITLTSKCFQKFCLMADNKLEKADMIRQFYIELLKGFKKMKQEIDRGEITITRNHTSQICDVLAESRVDAAQQILDTNQTVCEQLQWDLPPLKQPTPEEVKRHEARVKKAQSEGKKTPTRIETYPKRQSNNNIYGAIYGKANGEINKLICGQYAYEFKKRYDLKKSARLIDYMDTLLLNQRAYYSDYFIQLQANNPSWTHQELLDHFYDYIECQRQLQEKFPASKRGALRDPNDERNRLTASRAKAILDKKNKKNSKRRRIM
jgi:hypothetical protein